MIPAIADTHTLSWYLLADPRLSSNARTVIDAAASANAHIIARTKSTWATSMSSTPCMPTSSLAYS
ncbi:MAG: hypothetical protein AVDCRST_MAG93-1597 [uncultured Chloroflexia bacterium]|uniref:Uncharacterized protein n=1 Tax=uncultured Chloroflexia bacterium TaxID=1672391 RepID=A0A6J4IDW7_9CHLR|nr:MAG: hypothetical protein AVDCRST_MAG93-1597 [uncultured Chloroflexia bacterium]